MRSIRFLTVATLGVLALAAACGEDAVMPPPATTTSASGSGGEGAATSGSAGASVTSATGGVGGAPPGAELGEPCTINDDCDSGFCLQEQVSGWPLGYCTELCNDFAPCRAAGTVCTDVGGGQFCLVGCTPGGSGECLDHQQCFDLGGGPGICGPGCTSNAQCPALGSCDDETGLCVPPEICNDGVDNDGDDLTDCEDDDCASDCAAEIGAACGAAVSATTAQSGDTTGGTSLFAASCTGGAGALEDIYSYAASQSGYLRLTLDSATDQGIYVRSACDDATTELGCVDAVASGIEQLFVEVTSGQSYDIFVDGYYSPLEAGPYDLGLELLTASAETEDNGTPQMADAFTSGVVLAAIGVAGDEDWFTVTVPGPDSTLSATVIPGGADVCGPAGDIDTELEIYGTDGTTSLAFNEDISGFSNYCSGASTLDLAAGTYYVRVSASTTYCPNCTFDYALVIGVE
jgi:hypothetical protein